MGIVDEHYGMSHSCWFQPAILLERRGVSSHSFTHSTRFFYHGYQKGAG
jgi:hypothetical protein